MTLPTTGDQRQGVAGALGLGRRQPNARDKDGAPNKPSHPGWESVGPEFEFLALLFTNSATLSEPFSEAQFFIASK